MALFEFCFSSVSVYIGATIWLLIITGYFQNKIIPAIVRGWKRFINLFKKVQKEIEKS